MGTEARKCTEATMSILYEWQDLLKSCDRAAGDERPFSEQYPLITRGDVLGIASFARSDIEALFAVRFLSRIRQEMRQCVEKDERLITEGDGTTPPPRGTISLGKRRRPV